MLTLCSLFCDRPFQCQIVPLTVKRYDKKSKNPKMNQSQIEVTIHQLPPCIFKILHKNIVPYLSARLPNAAKLM